jgi:hypothetical protein
MFLLPLASMAFAIPERWDSPIRASFLIACRR